MPTTLILRCAKAAAFALCCIVISAKPITGIAKDLSEDDYAVHAQSETEREKDFIKGLRDLGKHEDAGKFENALFNWRRGRLEASCTYINCLVEKCANEQSSRHPLVRAVKNAATGEMMHTPFDYTDDDKKRMEACRLACEGVVRYNVCAAPARALPSTEGCGPLPQ